MIVVVRPAIREARGRVLRVEEFSLQVNRANRNKQKPRTSMISMLTRRWSTWPSMFIMVVIKIKLNTISEIAATKLILPLS